MKNDFYAFKNKKSYFAMTAHVIFDKFDHILVLCIEKPGFSGQIFLNESIDLIDRINNLNSRNKFKLSIDGGITKNQIKKFKCDYVVSGSDILNSKSPSKQIMKLQTLSRYEKE